MTDSRSSQTVLGPVDPEELGRTMMHKHVLCDFYRISGNSDQLLNDEQLAVDELAYLAQAGGTALVECTTSKILDACWPGDMRSTDRIR